MWTIAPTSRSPPVAPTLIIFHTPLSYDVLKCMISTPAGQTNHKYSVFHRQLDPHLETFLCQRFEGLRSIHFKTVGSLGGVISAQDGPTM